MSFQTIGYDKLNMLRHARFFRDKEGVLAHMEKHAAILRPKFRMVLDTLERELAGKGVAEWHRPRGGYFVSVNLVEGGAKETVALLKEAGVAMTGAGATYPYGRDPRDANIRIAPTYPPLGELQVAMELLLRVRRNDGCPPDPWGQMNTQSLARKKGGRGRPFFAVFLRQKILAQV